MNYSDAMAILQAAKQRLAAAERQDEREVAGALVEYWRLRVRQYQDAREEPLE